jgi:hypothetical protein
MATPSNRFEQVDEPGPDTVTVTLWDYDGQAFGHVLGPADAEHDKPPLVIAGQDDPMTAFQALVVGCQLANELRRKVVIVDPKGFWKPEWGRLQRS